VASRNTLFLLFLVGAVIIWFEQLRTLAAAVVVIAVAFVLATKEVWLNVTGFLFRAGTHFFSIGDRIEVGDLRGDVIDQRFTGTTILEIGPGTKSHQYTGRAVFIPNSKFLSSPVTNETYMKDFVFHIITVPIKADADWQKAEEALLKAANEVCAPYLEKARSYMKGLERQYSLDAPGVEPRVQIQLPEAADRSGFANSNSGPATGSIGTGNHTAISDILSAGRRIGEKRKKRSRFAGARPPRGE